MKSACDSAFFISVVKVKRSRDAPLERPMFVRSFHASSIYLRRLASAFGPGSVVTTSNPRARYSAAQLAPMTPAPTIAMRRTGFLRDMTFLLLCGLTTVVHHLRRGGALRRGCGNSGQRREIGQVEADPGLQQSLAH